MKTDSPRDWSRILPATLMLASLLLNLTSGCASGRSSTQGQGTEGGHPHLDQWLRDNSDPRYPADQFLTAVGFGSDANAAADSARAALLASFRTHIANTVERLEQESSHTRGDEVRYEAISFTTSELEATVKGTLEGAKLADATRDQRTGQSWALVVVHRATLAENLRRRIADHDRALAQIATQAGDFLAAGKIFRTLDLLRSVPEQLAELEAWRTELSLVQLGGKGLPSRSMTLGDYVDLRQRCAAEFTVALSVQATATDDDGTIRPLDSAVVAEQVKGALRGAIPGLGLVDTPELDGIDRSIFDGLPRGAQRELAGDANFLVRVRVDTDYSSRFGELYVYRSRYSARMLDLRSGEVLLADLSGTGGKSRPHANPTVAATNSLREVSAGLAAAIASSLR